MRNKMASKWMDGQQANQCTYRVEWMMKSYEQHTDEWWMEYNEWCSLTMNGWWMVNMNIWIWMLRLIITYIIQTLFTKSYKQHTNEWWM